METVLGLGKRSLDRTEGGGGSGLQASRAGLQEFTFGFFLRKSMGGETINFPSRGTRRTAERGLDTDAAVFQVVEEFKCGSKQTFSSALTAEEKLCKPVSGPEVLSAGLQGSKQRASFPAPQGIPLAAEQGSKDSPGLEGSPRQYPTRLQSQ